MINRTLTAFAFAAVACTAAAQTPAPAAAAPAAAPADTSAQCPKPDAHPGRLASAQRRTQWTKEVNEWQNCMKKLIADVQAKADAAVKVANSAVADSNAAIASYNATVKDLQAQADAAQ